MNRLNYTNEMTLHLKLNMRLNMSFLWTYGIGLSVFFFCKASSVQKSPRDGLKLKFSLAPSETLAPGKTLRGEGCTTQVFCNGSPKHDSNFSPYNSNLTEVVF